MKVKKNGVLHRHESLEFSRLQSALVDNTKTHSSSSRQRSDLQSGKGGVSRHMPMPKCKRKEGFLSRVQAMPQEKSYLPFYF